MGIAELNFYYFKVKVMPKKNVCFLKRSENIR